MRPGSRERIPATRTANRRSRMRKRELKTVEALSPDATPALNAGAGRDRSGGGPRLRMRAHARPRTVTFLGWQGYDDPVAFDDFLKTKDITLNTTYIGNNDEIVTKLRGGGIGTIDIVTPYMGYIPLLVKLDLIQPIDVVARAEPREGHADLPQRPQRQCRRQALRRALHLGRRPDDVRSGRHPHPADVVEGSAQAGIHRQGRHDGRSARQHDDRRAGRDRHARRRPRSTPRSSSRPSTS